MLSRFILGLSFLVLSSNLFAQETLIDCNGKSWKHGSLGELEKFSLGDKVTFESILKERLKVTVDELARWLTMETNPNGQDKEYIAGVIGLLESPPDSSLSCIWEAFQNGGEMHKFTEQEKYQGREGYILVRDSEFIAYFYTSMWQV